MVAQFSHELMDGTPEDVDLGILEVLLEEALDSGGVGIVGVVELHLDGDVLEATALFAGGDKAADDDAELPVVKVEAEEEERAVGKGGPDVVGDAIHLGRDVDEKVKIVVLSDDERVGFEVGAEEVVDEGRVGGGLVVGVVFEEGGEKVEGIVPAAEFARGKLAVSGESFEQETVKVGGEEEREVEGSEEAVNVVGIIGGEVVIVDGVNEVGERVEGIGRSEFLGKATEEVGGGKVKEFVAREVVALTAGEILSDLREIVFVGEGIVVSAGPGGGDVGDGGKPAAVDAVADDGSALGLLDHTDETGPKDARVLSTKDEATGVGFGGPEQARLETHKEDGDEGVGPVGGEEGGAGFVDSEIDLAVIEETEIESVAEVDGGLDGEEVLHSDDGGNADGDKFGSEPAEGVGGGAGSGLAGGEEDETGTNALTGKELSELVVKDKLGVAEVVLKVEDGLIAFGTEGAVAEEVEDVETRMEAEGVFDALEGDGRVEEGELDEVRIDRVKGGEEG